MPNLHCSCLSRTRACAHTHAHTTPFFGCSPSLPCTKAHTFLTPLCFLFLLPCKACFNSGIIVPYSQLGISASFPPFLNFNGRWWYTLLARGTMVKWWACSWYWQWESSLWGCVLMMFLPSHCLCCSLNLAFLFGWPLARKTNSE